MAVAIDNLQVETQASAPAASAPAAAAPSQAQPDMKAEMERLHERELRLRAD